ncbi:MAG: HD-GYP domain-containing protein [Candidatus Omnitrophica bacterium]|nr:HD-GYP domain-containing protein [Candidatus Omnitrophota bacterium]
MDKVTTRNNIKQFVKNFSLLITESFLYPMEHPNVIAQASRVFSQLSVFFDEQEEINIDISEGQFAFDGIPLYEIKQFTEKTAQLLQAKQITSISFKKELPPKSLARLISLFIEKSPPLDAQAIQKALEKEGMFKIVIEKVRPIENKNVDMLPSFDKIYGSSVEANKLVYSVLHSGNKIIPMDVVEKIAQDITAMILKDDLSGLALTSLRNYDEYTFTHSANVAILSVALTRTFISDSLTLNSLAKAALLHDIGKINIPIEILNKPGKLTDEEWLIMKEHPVNGAKIIEQQSHVDQLSVIIALEHHMKYDLSGYPNISQITQLHPLASLVNICDVYDAITSKRPYKKPLSPDKTLAIMMRLIGCDFDPQFFKIFIQMLGIYPVGSLVRLNTKEYAITKKVHPQALLMPEIKIIMDSKGKLLEEPFTINLADKEQNAALRNIEEVVDPETIGIDLLNFF